MKFPKINDLNVPVKRTEKFIKKHYNEFYDFLTHNYLFCNTFHEKLYCYFNDIIQEVVCPICGKRVNFISFKEGYRIYCSNYCLTHSEIRNKNIKKTKLERYGDENYNNIDKIKNTCIYKYNSTTPLLNNDIKEKTKKTNFEKYGNEIYQRTNDFKNKIKNTFIENYGVDNCFKCEEIKAKIRQTCIKCYGVDNYTKTKKYKDKILLQQKEIQEKIYQTKKQNNSFNSSKIEKQFEDYLKENNINYKKQYKSEIYPFSCDFYLPDKDLYIEINAHWTHGGHPFDSTNKEDQLQLESWKQKGTKFYDNAIETWTTRDVSKRNIAKQNKLNYLEIFSNKIQDIINSL